MPRCVLGAVIGPGGPENLVGHHPEQPLGSRGSIHHLVTDCLGLGLGQHCSSFPLIVSLLRIRIWVVIFASRSSRDFHWRFDKTVTLSIFFSHAEASARNYFLKDPWEPCKLSCLPGYHITSRSWTVLISLNCVTRWSYIICVWWCITLHKTFRFHESRFCFACCSVPSI